MQTVRVILYWEIPLDTFLPCAKEATEAGMHLIVSVQFNMNWSIDQTRAWFQAAISMYGPLGLYAMSIGNEEELGQSGGTPQRYAQVWSAVEPMLAAELPGVLRVAGEISPWGLGWLEAAIQSGLPGAQVFAGHPYPDSGRGFDPGVLATLAQESHIQAWVTEGMCGPDAWQRYGCIPRSEIQVDGISLGIDWYASPTIFPPTQPTPPIHTTTA